MGPLVGFRGLGSEGCSRVGCGCLPGSPGNSWGVVEGGISSGFGAGIGEGSCPGPGEEAGPVLRLGSEVLISFAFCPRFRAMKKSAAECAP